MPSRKPIRALVVDDSHFVRTVVSDILEKQDIDVVDTARNGVEAVQKVTELSPDVVTMDVEMPEMDGIEAVDAIMDENPTPILMLSAHTEEGAQTTFDALEKGAIDFYPKPGGEVSTRLSSHEEKLVSLVRSVAAAEVSQRPVEHETPESTRKRTYVDYPTLLMGSSTGGPQVVEQILSSLPGDTDLRILIVQHMPASFTSRFARRLDSACDFDVVEGEDGLRIGGGEAVVAPGDRHLVVDSYARGRLRLRLSDDPPVHSSRPAVDPMMKSAADTITDSLVGVILTGMGRDGAAGIEALKQVGATTIAQDKSTSAVDSMPRHAIETGCVDFVKPDQSIPETILEAISTSDPL